jgi:hypothetical protein
MSDTVEIAIPPGLVAVTTHGIMQSATAQSIWEARSHTERAGVHNIRWEIVPGSLVDKARNDACRLMLQDGRQWLLFLDCDMIFPKESILRLLQTAFHSHQWADVVGGYCNLRGELAIPTIDTGTGTWESHFPNSGVKEVIRTGGAFLLVKRRVCETMPQPWFATRVPMRPIDAIAELDNFARIKFDGTNPLRETASWEILERIARDEPSSIKEQWVPAEVGEDSGFCDKVRSHGMRIVVDTHVITGHLHQQTIDWSTHKTAMQRRKQEHRALCGIG